MTSFRVPFMALAPGEDAQAVDAAVQRVVRSGWYVLGPEVEAFARAFARARGARYGVGVGNGTDAIALALRALGIGPGDEVVTAPLSAAYTALAVIMAGARPVFADIDPNRLTLDPAAVETAIGPRTAAILPVHLYGQPADLPRLAAIAARHGLALVEDCCQAHLAACEGRPVGTVGVAGAFSFYPTKNLGALGDGGAVVTGDPSLAERVKRLRNGGQTDRYHHAEAGINSRLDELQAAILGARLSYLEGWTARRRALAARYRRKLSAAEPCVDVPPEFDRGHVYHLFTVRSGSRDDLRAFLADRGIETLVHYPVPIPRQPALAAQEPAECPVAERVCRETLSLPLYPSMAHERCDEVAAAIGAFGRLRQ
ncbi:MAG TPA: DegT/DnrJ/EryC1/StrS family aminotransferase [Vicinamibacterales bacterium]|nr:DegT/DnrJ/EryC1/StrS family aminotransferase [Vicinamibacterales bacterium]